MAIGNQDLEEARWYQAWPVGVVTFALGLAPLWVTWHALAAFFSGEEPFGLSIVAWSLGPLVITAWFFGLTYRLFTLRGRAGDGGLIGPLTLLAFSLLTLFLGFFGLWVAWRDSELQSLYGAFVFLGLAAGGLSLGAARLRARRARRARK